MASQLKHIKLWGRAGLNSSKIRIILEELSLPYDAISVPLDNVKDPEYTAINPNGRLPTIYDPNTYITLWESGAIMEYLMETYDKDNLLSFAPGTQEYFQAKQWLFFQTSGQGPNYGQAAWFKMFHHEHLPGAVIRFVDEVKRVTSVLEGHLAQQKRQHGDNSDGPWLVGNKLSYVDVMFVPYQRVAVLLFKEDGFDEDDYSHVKEWFANIMKKEKASYILDNFGRSEGQAVNARKS